MLARIELTIWFTKIGQAKVRRIGLNRGISSPDGVTLLGIMVKGQRLPDMHKRLAQPHCLE